MKKVSTKLIAAITVILLLVAITGVKAQREFKPVPAKGASDFNLTLRNYVQVNSKTIEFDIYMVDMNAAEPFELATVQVGIKVNPAIINGGSLSVAVVPGASDLQTNMVPTNVVWVPQQNCIKLTPKTPAGAGKGFILPTVAPGARVCRLRVTNTKDFADAAEFETLSFTTVPYPTKVAQYIHGINTELVCNSSNCFGLHAPVTLGINDNGLGSVQVYSSEATIYVKNPDNRPVKKLVVYDLTGNEVFKSDLSQGLLQNFHPGVTKGDYVVKVSSDKGVVTRKVYLN